MALSPEQYASELRFKLSLQGRVDVEQVASSLGIRVYEDELDGCDGVLLRLDGKALIITSRKCTYSTRKRFTIAHESGHFCIPSHDSCEFRCTEAESSSYRAISLFEREGNKFAGELLLPLSEIEKVLKGPPSMRLI